MRKEVWFWVYDQKNETVFKKIFSYNPEQKPPQDLYFRNEAGEKNKVYANNLKIKKSGEIYDRMGSEYTFFKLEEKEKMKAFVEQKTRRLKEKRKKLQLFLILNKRFW